MMRPQSGKQGVDLPAALGRSRLIWWTRADGPSLDLRGCLLSRAGSARSGRLGPSWTGGATCCPGQVEPDLAVVGGRLRSQPRRSGLEGRLAVPGRSPVREKCQPEPEVGCYLPGQGTRTAGRPSSPDQGRPPLSGGLGSGAATVAI
jgi:hypothetical protein